MPTTLARETSTSFAAGCTIRSLAAVCAISDMKIVMQADAAYRTVFLMFLASRMKCPATGFDIEGRLSRRSSFEATEAADWLHALTAKRVHTKRRTVAATVRRFSTQIETEFSAR